MTAPHAASPRRPRTAGGRLLTRPVSVAAGSALDPRAEQITWTAWRLRGARIADSEGAVVAGAALLARAIEALWLPGRLVALTELSWEPARRALHVRLAVGVIGPLGATEAEAEQVSDYMDSLLGEPHVPFAAVPEDAACLLDVRPQELAHTALIRQRVLDLDVGTGADGPAGVAVLSRFSPVLNSAESVARALVTRKAPTRFRATVLPTELGPDERAGLDAQIRVVAHARRHVVEHPELALTLERAQSTLQDVKASFASPLLGRVSPVERL